MNKSINCVLLIRSCYFLYNKHSSTCSISRMENCQSRSENKINFHVNASLTTVSLAKAGTVLTENQDTSSFSMADVKVVFSNKILAEFIFSKLALDLSCKKISCLYLECLDVGRLVA